jgi:hypothetical protein
MPWLPAVAARGSPSTLSTLEALGFQVRGSRWLFQSGYGVATDTRRAPKKRSLHHGRRRRHGGHTGFPLDPRRASRRS